MYIWFKYRRVKRQWLPINGLKLWRLDNTIRHYGHCACSETPIYELSVKKQTPPFALATSISN